MPDEGCVQDVSKCGDTIAEGLSAAERSRNRSAPLSNLCKPRCFAGCPLLFHGSLICPLQSLFSPLTHRRGPELLLLLTASPHTLGLSRFDALDRSLIKPVVDGVSRTVAACLGCEARLAFASVPINAPNRRRARFFAAGLVSSSTGAGRLAIPGASYSTV